MTSITEAMYAAIEEEPVLKHTILVHLMDNISDLVVKKDRTYKKEKIGKINKKKKVNEQTKEEDSVVSSLEHNSLRSII